MKTCAVVLVFALLAQQTAAAQAIERSLVSRAELDAVLVSTGERRTVNLEKIRQALDGADASRVAAGLIDAGRLSSGVAMLDDRTLDRLARESDAVPRQQGSGKSNRILVIVFLTLVILAVVASALLPESS